jgi:hypothetical protein
MAGGDFFCLFLPGDKGDARRITEGWEMMGKVRWGIMTERTVILPAFLFILAMAVLVAPVVADVGNPTVVGDGTITATDDAITYTIDVTGPGIANGDTITFDTDSVDTLNGWIDNGLTNDNVVVSSDPAAPAWTRTVDGSNSVLVLTSPGDPFIGTVTLTLTGTAEHPWKADTHALGGTLYAGALEFPFSIDNPPPPTVTVISPSSGPLAGTSVTITGTHFTGATAVTFGGTAATIYSVTDDTHITATTPASITAGAKDVAVTAPGGTGTKPGGFTYQAAPTISTVSPGSGPRGGGTSVTITGIDFTGATAVTFGGTAATIYSVTDDTHITATTPASISAGAKDVAVTAPGGTVTKTDGFTYLLAPTISTVSPASGPLAGGTSVTITGTDFTGVTAVTFGGTAATSFSFTDDTHISATTPAGKAGGKDVAVITPGGTGTNAGGFTYQAAPTVTSVSPGSGPLAGVTNVTITGTDFTGATAVTFGGNAATNLSVKDDTHLNVSTPAGTAGLADVTVTTPGGAGTKAGGFTYIVAPTVSSVSPTYGPVSRVTNVSITGTGFTGATAVTFGGKAATNLSVKDDSHINVTAPRNDTAGYADVTVTTPGGPGTLSSGFRYLNPPLLDRAPVGQPGYSAVNTNTSWNVSITGQDFVDKPTVRLIYSHYGQITATNVTVDTPNRINCTFNLFRKYPDWWDIVVVNPDGQSDTYSRGFLIETITPTVTAISPDNAFNTDLAFNAQITGTGFLDGATVNLTNADRTVDFEATGVTVVDSEHITCTFDLTGRSEGNWFVYVTNHFGLDKNNLFQMATLAVKNQISPPPPSGPSGSSGSGPAPVENQPPPQSEAAASAPSTAETAITAALQTNADGVTTQETALQSTDNMATVSIPQGTVAKAADLSPLTSVSIAPVSESGIPADTSGKRFTFAGRAYDLGPNGATFSPSITLTFTVSNPQPGQEYTIRTFDRPTNAWVDLSTTYHPESGTVTTQVSSFCYFALFAKTPVPPVATTIAQPVPSPTQGTGTFILSGMILWGVTLLKQHPLVIPAIVILAVGIFLYGMKRRGDRKKRQRERLMGHS